AARRNVRGCGGWCPFAPHTAALRVPIGSGVQCAKFSLGEFSPRPSPDGSPLGEGELSADDIDPPIHYVALRCLLTS
ncbi:MAG TPA: hypothetical protein VMF08_10630, partial [Candidatus Sulfotelmatobacter sp.]|nr:hypothetical protein [Candidatus Sulfotelmatobacter sp.]